MGAGACPDCCMRVTGYRGRAQAVKGARSVLQVWLVGAELAADVVAQLDRCPPRPGLSPIATQHPPGCLEKRAASSSEQQRKAPPPSRALSRRPSLAPALLPSRGVQQNAGNVQRLCVRLAAAGAAPHAGLWQPHVGARAGERRPPRRPVDAAAGACARMHQRSPPPLSPLAPTRRRRRCRLGALPPLSLGAGLTGLRVCCCCLIPCRPTRRAP